MARLAIQSSGKILDEVVDCRLLGYGKASALHRIRK